MTLYVMHYDDISFIFIISAWLGSVTIDYSCNPTSRELNGPMLRVKIQTLRPNSGPSSVKNDLEYKAG